MPDQAHSQDRRRLFIAAGALVAGSKLIQPAEADAALDDPVYLALAAAPESLISGTVSRNDEGVILSAQVRWPDGTEGSYEGTPSEDVPGATDGYTITYGTPPLRTYTQPAVTRDPISGLVVERPPITSE